MDSIFFEIAFPKLHHLSSLGASVTTELACKCDIVVIQKNAKRIEVIYEAYGPPFCDVKSSGGYYRRIEVDVAFPSAERMGRGDKTEAALAAFKNDLCSYIETLYPLLENELRKKESIQSPMKKTAPFLINGTLLVAYLYFELKVLHQMHVEERHWPQDVGGADSITYVCTAGPALFAMLAFNLGWIVVQCLRMFRERPFNWKAGFTPLGIMMVWATIFLTRSFWLPVLWNVV